MAHKWLDYSTDVQEHPFIFVFLIGNNAIVNKEVLLISI